MGIDVTEMQRLAGVVPSDDGYHSYRHAVGAKALDEDIATGAKGWLSGVMKALGTWKGKMQKGGATPAQMSALDGVEQALKAAMGKLGEGVEALDADDSLFEEDVPAFVKGADLDAFNTALAKLCAKLKKDLGAVAVRQNYKGTGKQKHRRQLYVSFKDIPGPDLWLDTGYAQIGGVVFMPFADRSPISYEGKTPAEVYAEILKRMKLAQEKIQQALAAKAAKDAAAGAPSGALPVPTEALESVGRDDIFGDHLNWARALDGNSLVEAKKSEADKARDVMVMGLWKKYNAQLHGTGYAKIDKGTKKHMVTMMPDGSIGDLIALSAKGKATALEDMSDEELKTLFLKALKWLGQFEGPWFKKNLEVIKSLLPAA